MGWELDSRFNGFPVYGNMRSGFHGITRQLGANYTLRGRFFLPNDYGDPVAEYWGIRRTAGLVDVSAEKIIGIRGADASKLANRLLTRDVSILESGECIYSPLCYEDGGIINDGILLKFDDETFWYSGGSMGKDDAWWVAHARDFNASAEYISDEWSILQLQGPSSLNILREVVAADIDGMERFGFVETEVAGRYCVVARTGWSGEEFGYEVYVRAEDAEPVWMAIWQAGHPRGMTIAGGRALDMRRIEQGTIHSWGSDFDERNNPFEVNLGWTVDFGKEDFIGRRRLAELYQMPARTKFVGIELEGPVSADYRNDLIKGDRRVGYVTAAAYSPYLGKSIALAHVERELASPGQSLMVRKNLQLSIPAEIVPRPFGAS